MRVLVKKMEEIRLNVYWLNISALQKVNRLPNRAAFYYKVIKVGWLRLATTTVYKVVHHFFRNTLASLVVKCFYA